MASIENIIPNPNAPSVLGAPVKMRTIYFGITQIAWGNIGFNKVAYVLTSQSSLPPSESSYTEIDSTRIIGSGPSTYKLWFYPTEIWDHYYCKHFNATNPYTVDIPTGSSDVSLYARTLLNEYDDGCIGRYYYFTSSNLSNEIKNNWEIKFYTDEACTNEITSRNPVQYIRPSVTITGGNILYYTITHKFSPELYVKKVYKVPFTDNNFTIMDLERLDPLHDNLFEFKTDPTLPECKIKFVDKNNVTTGVKGIRFIDKDNNQYNLNDIVFEPKDN